MRTVVWLLRIADGENIQDCLSKARSLGCNTVGLNQIGCYSIDVPEDVSILEIDRILEDVTEVAAVAFPSLRHKD
jgi:hypothetical protein